MEKVRIGVVGCGNVARSTYLPAFQRPALAEKADLVAVFSRTADKARWAQETLGAREYYTDHAQLLASPDLDAVVNLTPKLAHARLGVETLEAGKHLYLEKPMSTRLEDADRLVAESKGRGLTLVCAPSIPIWPVTLKAQELLESGAIGEPCFARARASSAGPGAAWYYMKGAGPVLDLAVYSLTQLTALLGPARRVAAFSGLSIPERELRDGTRIRPTEDDNTQMMVDFGNSVFASCDATFVVKGYQGPWLELFGTEGALSIWRDGLHMWLEVYHEQPEHDLNGWVAARRPRLDHIALFSLGLEELVDSILSNREPRIGGERARHTLDIMLAAYESARLGRTIELDTSF
jgi:predicted dehydrogenase